MNTVSYPHSHTANITCYVFQVLPYVLSLLPGRSATIYNHIFELLEQEAADRRMTFEPDTITTDFEKGLIKSVKNHVSFFLSQNVEESSRNSSSFPCPDMLDVSFILLKVFIGRFRILVCQLSIRMRKKFVQYDIN